MTVPILIDLPSNIKDELWAHLMPKGFLSEGAAFVFVSNCQEADAYVFTFLDWFPVPSTGFSSRSSFHLELKDEIRGLVIKKAHDLGVSIIEFHSHSGRWPASFSGSDLSGLEEFVPHVWWRLKGRPYGAVVVARSGFDGLIWLHSPGKPLRLDAIRVEGKSLKATNLSFLSTERYEQRPI